MFQFNDISAGSGGGTAVLSLDSALRPALSRSFGRRIEEFRATRPDFDLVTDLGVRIGSAEWFRGLTTCAILCYAAYAFAPGFGPISGASPAPLADVQWEEARTFAIAPLALGADTGRRMAPTEAVEPLADTPERPTVDLVVTLGRGDRFARVLERAGTAEAEAQKVSDMVAAAVDLGDIKPGTVMDVRLGRRPNRNVPRPLEALSFRARFDLKIKMARADDKLVLTKVPIAVDNTPLRIQGRVGSSLYRAARAAGAPAKAVEAYIRAVASQIGISSIDADDRFDIIIEHRRAATGETESGPLLYAGLERSRGKDLQLMQWDQGGRAQWFEASGVGKSSGSLQRPVPGSVSSNFGMRRHPILGYSRMHKGMDFRAGYGTPILAATDGRVTRAGWAGGYGRQVRLNHAGGLATSYSHMSRIVAKPGQRVRQGQVIGYVGSTGLSTGPHLHYELYRNGRPVNPASVKFTMRAQLSGSDLTRFRQKLRNLLSVRVGATGPKENALAASPAKTANSG
ncbi:M23 family metallopeptidase [Sphingosinicella rhizophila]|uniref:M23 family metallopeptidase n=1 Tax=Sphingosinicella rhizophila TaxID=3050082 RepID=A0ABU3Q8D4_9SPHN|nr:M23 family metallopeptidase [Sphingosinicella sp. GR2756]MDT9599675.1 M23 family metallopeptidase [Sphingosinicella sp. GR2756]